MKHKTKIRYVEEDIIAQKDIDNIKNKEVKKLINLRNWLHKNHKDILNEFNLN